MNNSTKHVEAASNILFFSPYGLFMPHIMQEMILTQRFLLRGHQVTHISCDKMFDLCDYKTECTKCHNISKSHLADANFQVKWLSQFTDLEDRNMAHHWLHNLEPKNYTTAKFENMNLGDWVRSSIHFTLKVSHLDFSNPEILKTYRDFLVEGFVFARAANRLLNEGKYDKIIMTNGRFFSHRILLEIAKLRNIPVVTHEYGHYFQSFQVQYGLLANSYGNLSTKWHELNRIPINLQALSHVHQIVLDKRYQRRFTFGFFTPLPTLKNKQIKSEKKIVLCALSSEYEYNASPDYAHTIGTQVDWMKLLIPEIQKYQDHHFIIKLHPNSEKSIVTDLEKLFSQVNLSNCEVLWPDTKMSTYDLIDQAEYIMVYWSTVGMEAACAGKKVFCITRCSYYGAPFLKSLTSAESHAKELNDFLLDLNPISNIREEAYRFCYRYFIGHSIPFTSTCIPKGSVTIYNQPIETYRNSKELPHDPYLDHIVESIEKEKYPDTAVINGSYQDKTGIHERFFFRCLSLIQNFGHISTPKKKFLILINKKNKFSNHCFENQVRLSIFQNSTELDWITFFLLLDGNQVYTINPDDHATLEQWAHEFGIFSGSHNIKFLLNSPVLFKIASEILFKSPLLTKLGRKFLFLTGKLQNKSSTQTLYQRFISWYAPDMIIDQSWIPSKIFNSSIQDFSFSEKNIQSLMDHPHFEESLRNIFTALQSQIR